MAHASEQTKIRHIIAVSSGKGGVGKSTVSVNLASALQSRGLRVGILDADIHGPNIPLMMGVNTQPHIEKDAGGAEWFVPPEAHGIRVMSMGFLMDPEQPAIWRGPMLHNLLTQFSKQIQWGPLDVLVVDMPPGTGDVQISLAQLFEIRGAVVVTTPQEVALQDVRKAYTMWNKVKVPIIGVVENMSYFEPTPGAEKHYVFGRGGGAALADRYRVPLLGEIPLSQKVREGGDEGRPVARTKDDVTAAQVFDVIAEQVIDRVEAMAAENVDPSKLVQIGRFD